MSSGASSNDSRSSSLVTLSNSSVMFFRKSVRSTRSFSDRHADSRSWKLSWCRMTSSCVLIFSSMEAIRLSSKNLSIFSTLVSIEATASMKTRNAADTIAPRSFSATALWCLKSETRTDASGILTSTLERMLSSRLASPSAT